MVRHKERREIDRKTGRMNHAVLDIKLRVVWNKESILENNYATFLE
jgi:hypothetical protein